MRMWGDEPAIIPESSVDICMVFSYPFSTAALRTPGSLKVMAGGKPFLCFAISSHLTIHTAKPLYFPPLSPTLCYLYFSLEASKLQLPAMCSPFLAWGTQWGRHSQLGWEWPLSSVLRFMRPFHTWGSKRLSELPKELVELWPSPT